MTSFISQHAADVDPTIARLGGIILRQSELSELVRSRQLQSSEAHLPDNLDYLVRSELATRAVLAEAVARGWSARPDIAAEVERYRARLIIGRYLDSLTSPPPDYPTEADLQIAYDANKETLRVPRQFRIAQIYLSFVADADHTEQNAFAKRIAELAAKARAKSADFAELAKSNSQHKESAELGGEIGWVTEDIVVPEIRSVLLSLAVNEVSSPVRTVQGWHIVKLLEHRASRPGTFEEVRALLVRGLRLSRAQESERAHIDRLMGQVVMEAVVRGG